MTDPDLPAALIAEAIVACDTLAVTEAAARYGLRMPDLRKWKKAARTDPEVAAAVRDFRDGLRTDWRRDAAETFVALGADIRSQLKAGVEIPFAVIAAAKAYGAILIEAGALLEDAAPAKATTAEPATLRLVEAGEADQ